MYRRYIKKINKKNPDLVFEKITPHCFRHTFATRWLEAGVPIKTVSTILGHSQLQLTTDLYMHVTQDSMFEGLAQFERMRSIGKSKLVQLWYSSTKLQNINAGKWLK